MARAFAAAFVSVLALAPSILPAATFPYMDGIVGAVQQYKVGDGESMIEIARWFDLGFNSMVDANPGVDPFVPVAGSSIVIPTSWILPAVSSNPAIIINLPELRLYFIPKSPPGFVMTFPLGIGDEGTETPVGNFTVIDKIVNPSWHVPDSIRKNDMLLPKVMPAGPDNPMGSHALRLSHEGILIHGTNRAWGIGRRSSHGCLRLYPEDIVGLFSVIPTGMRVVIVDQPIKVAGRDNRVFVEVHPDERGEPTPGEAIRMLAEKKLLVKTDFAKLIRAVKEKRGMPVDVTLDNGRPATSQPGSAEPAAGAGSAAKGIRNRGAP